MDTKNFVVLGCGRFGSSVAMSLYELGHDVLAIDNNEENIQEIADKVTHAVQADCTDEHALRSLGIRNFDVAVVSIASDIHSSIMATLLVKEMGVPYVLCKAMNARQAKVLYKIGADQVVFPERDMGIRVAHSLVSRNIIDFIELNLQYSIAEITIPAQWVGKTMEQLSLRAKHGLNVIAYKRGGQIDISPNPKMPFYGEDILIVVGKNEDIEKIEGMKRHA